MQRLLLLLVIVGGALYLLKNSFQGNNNVTSTNNSPSTAPQGVTSGPNQTNSPSVAPPQRVTPSPREITTKGNNGDTNCTYYCNGVDGSPWNNELPREWNGAECVRTTNGTPCDIRTPGKALGCVCRAPGRGWYQGGARFSNVITPGKTPNSAGEITTNGNNGDTNCTYYCNGVDGSLWNNELPKEWNGAECVRTTNGTPCGKRTPGRDLGCVCRATERGWYGGGPRYSDA